MPTNCLENLTEFTQCLSKISSVLDDNRDADAVYMLGDFNAHPGECFFKEMLDFCIEQSWHCVDIDFLGCRSDTFTYVSEAHGCARWLDHCVVTGAALQSVQRIWVDYDMQWSDHFPLYVQCDVGKLPCKMELHFPNSIDKVVWGERSVEQIKRFHFICNSRLREIDFPQELSDCCDGVCFKIEHKNVLKNMYKDIVTILSDAAIETYTRVRVRVRRRGGYIAGWNRHVAGYHREARLKFLAWVDARKPQSGRVFEEMCVSRRSFKQQLKWCQDRQDQIKMDILASRHTAKDFKGFWKETGKINAKPGLPVSIDGISDHNMIANMFGEHFRIKSGQVITTACGEADAKAVMPGRSIAFSTKNVRKVINAMKRGKSPGHDSISIEHLRCAGVHLPRVLSMFFNLSMSHGYLPDELTRTVVVPIVKCKTGDASDKGNYRPISLATVIAKVFDSLLNDILQQYIKLHDNQFGFRAGLSTESAILCLKRAVRYYTDRKTPIYSCFLDLSKAFDTVLYNKLWDKLRVAGVPAEVIRILNYWYCCQRNQVRWGSSLSEAFDMKCGVRQGGITSPLLFNLYINDLINKLSSNHIGCFIDGVCVNNISYADDMVLLGPSVGAIRKLVAICEAYAAEFGLKYNAKKSEVLVFRSGKAKPAHIPSISLDGAPLKVVSQFLYLGHVVTEDQKDDADLERERRALAVRGNMICRRFSRCSNEVKITLFRAYCQCFYTSSLWFNFTQRTANSLRVQYNNIFRMLLRLPSYCSASGMFAEARVDGYHAIIRKKVASLRQRVWSSGNSLLKMIALRMDCPIQNHWMRILISEI